MNFLDARLPPRFWDKVIPEPNSGCWLWLASTISGYGKYKTPSSYLAHCASYAALVGPVPAGLELDHKCRNRPCVNPAHLEPVTHRVNVLRGVAPSAVNARKDRCGVCGGPYVPEGNARRCESCHRVTGLRSRERKKEAGLCRNNKAHGLATNGLRCAECARVHREVEAARRTGKAVA